MKSENGEQITRLIVSLICIVLYLSALIAATASAFQTNLSQFLQLA